MTEQTRVPVGVRFKEAGKVYYFDAREAEPSQVRRKLELEEA